MCECVITKLCDECLYWLIYIHQLMHVNLLYQCLRLYCSCLCVVECHLWLEIMYVQQTLFAKSTVTAFDTRDIFSLTATDFVHKD